MKYGSLFITVIFLCLLISCSTSEKETVSEVNDAKYSIAKDKRYLIYDVNHGEGFNLRRDVYMRIANTVKLLRDSGENFVLVLPPWGPMNHWKEYLMRLPWGDFFDMPSLNHFVPIMEFEEFLEENPKALIDTIIYLQHYKEGWGAEYVMKHDKRDCVDNVNRLYKQDDEGFWKQWFFSYFQVKAKHFECISIQGDAKSLADMILEDYKTENILFIDRTEVILHHEYGGVDYWRARRSMRYAKNLIAAADEFREAELGSTDEKDSTILSDNWRDEIPRRNAKGGNYLCAHWRRRDFVRAHSEDVPSIEETAKQLNIIVERENLARVFIATDAEHDEASKLRELLKVPLATYRNTKNLNEGQVAIVEQWICAHAAFFIGTHHSTFSFRIQEDREILGFPEKTTFNRLCPHADKTCERVSIWKIVYE